jgi:hypothetical protein
MVEIPESGKTDELLYNLDRVHTTELGVLRIKKNLSLDVPDVVEWCKRAIVNADEIIRAGKNWYTRFGDTVITVNARSYTIITAHKERTQSIIEE